MATPTSNQEYHSYENEKKQNTQIDALLEEAEQEEATQDEVNDNLPDLFSHQASISTTPPCLETACLNLFRTLKAQVDKQHDESKEEPPSDQKFLNAVTKAIGDGHILSALKNLTYDCSICPEPVLNGTPLTLLPCCGTYFHDTDDCLRGWTKNDDRCPTCQTPHGPNRRPITDQERAESMGIDPNNPVDMNFEDDILGVVPCYLCQEPISFEIPNQLHASCWECGQYLCTACVTANPSLNYALGRGHPTCRQCRPNPIRSSRNPEPIYEEVKEEEVKEEEDPRHQEALDLVRETARLCQNKTLRDLQEALGTVTDLYDAEEKKIDDITERLNLNIQAVNGDRHLFLLGAYNTGCYLKRYCEDNEVSQAQAVKDLKIRGLNKNNASLFVKFAEVINQNNAHKFLYTCTDSWRTVRGFLTTDRTSEVCFLASAFFEIANSEEEEDGGLADALFGF